MKLATFRVAGTTTWGLIEGEEAVDLGAALRARLPDLKSAIAVGAPIGPACSATAWPMKS